MVSTTQGTVSSINEEVDKLGYKLVHKNERRLRIYLPRLAVDTEYAQTLKQVIESFDFITDVRMNIAAKSLAIEYNNQGITSTLIQKKILNYIEQANIAETPQNLADIDFKLDNAAIKTVSFVGYEVVHKNDRRLRIVIPRLAEDVEYARKLKYLLELINGVVDIRVNAILSCIAVEFDYKLNQQEVIEAQEQVFTAIQK